MKRKQKEQRKIKDRELQRHKIQKKKKKNEMNILKLKVPRINSLDGYKDRVERLMNFKT